jgi:hypothetical protein
LSSKQFVELGIDYAVGRYMQFRVLPALLCCLYEAGLYLTWIFYARMCICSLLTAWRRVMVLDLLITALASAVIGWNLGTWLVPACWLAIVCVAATAATARERVAWMTKATSLLANRV